MRNIPICEEKSVIVWRCGISRMVCNCKMRVQQKVGLHCEGGCSFQFLLTSPHHTTYKVPDIVLATSCLCHIYVCPFLSLVKLCLILHAFLFCGTMRGAKNWNTSALPRGCRKIVMKVRDRYSFALKTADMGLMQPLRTYAIAWKYKNWRAGLSVKIDDWSVIFHFYRH